MTDYEIVSKTPLKRLEDKLSILERKLDEETKEFYKELVSVIRLNQEIVDELAKSNDALRLEIARLVPQIENLIKNIQELINYIKAAASEEGEISQEGESKLDKVLETNKKLLEANRTIISLLQSIEKSLRRPIYPILKKQIK